MIKTCPYCSNSFKGEKRSRFCSVDCARRGRAGVRVRRLDTGVVYPSIAAAARALWVVPGSVWSAIERGGECAGVRLERVGRLSEEGGDRGN